MLLLVVAATVASQEQLQAMPSAHTYQTQPDGNRLLVDQSPLQHWMVGEEGGREGEGKRRWKTKSLFVYKKTTTHE